MNNLSPIVIFVFNRVKHLSMLIESLKNNREAKYSNLFIFSDGPKTDEDITKVDQVRKYLKSIKGFKSIEVFEQDSNLGLSKSVINGVSKIINSEKKAIILEDDMIVSPNFLEYMNIGLTKFKEEKKIASIHGYCYPVKDNLPHFFFLKGADCWGWATWKDRWELIELNPKNLIQKIKESNQIKKFNFDWSYDYFKMLEDNLKEKNDSWAIRWHASMFLKNKLTLYPGKSLVRNNGVDGTGTHSEKSNYFDINLSNQKIILDNLELKESPIAYDSFKKFFLQRKSLLFKLKSKLKNLKWT